MKIFFWKKKGGKRKKRGKKNQNERTDTVDCVGLYMKATWMCRAKTTSSLRKMGIVIDTLTFPGFGSAPWTTVGSMSFAMSIP